MSNPNPCIENLALGRGKKPKLAHQSYKINLSAKDKDILEVIAEAYECTYGGKGSISALLTKIAREELLITPQVPHLYLTTLKPYTCKQVPLISLGIEQTDSIYKPLTLSYRVMSPMNALNEWYKTNKNLQPIGLPTRDSEKEGLKNYRKLPISIQKEDLILSVSSILKQNGLEEIEMETTFILFSENHRPFTPGIIEMSLLDEQGNKVYYPESKELIKTESNEKPDVSLTINHGKDKFFIKIVVGDEILLEAFECN